MEERLIAVQDFESRLDELDKLAEIYQVSSMQGPGTLQHSDLVLCSCSAP